MIRRALILAGALALLGVASTAAAQAPPTTAPATTVPPITTTTTATTVVDGRGGIPPLPVLVVTPDTGLVDGQTVALSGTGWGPVIGPVLCGAATEWEDCLAVGRAEADSGGNLSGSATLPAVFTTPDGIVVDCRAEHCKLVASNYRGNGDSAPVSFASVIAASPGFTG